MKEKIIVNISDKGKKILKRKSRKFIGTDTLEAVLDRMAVITDIYIPAYAQHQKVFPKYKGINKGKTVVLVGTGPTLKYYSPIEDAIHIGVNNAVFKDNIKLDYLFACDFTYTEYFEEVFSVEQDCANFFGINYRGKGALIPEFILERYNVEMFYADSFNYELFGNEFERAEKLFYPLDISVSPFKSYGTTMFCAFQFALWTHPAKIYIVGADCSMTGHAEGIGYDKQRADTLGHSYLVEPWKKSKEFADNFYPDIEIFSINPVGLKGVFKDIYTEKF